MSRCRIVHAAVLLVEALLAGSLVIAALLPALGCGSPPAAPDAAPDTASAPAGQAAAMPGAAALLPADDEVPGWSTDGEPTVFRGAELYGHIDGGAEVFLELGFARLDVQHYVSGEAELALELYLMDDPVAAWGIYLAKCGRETPDPGLEARHTVNRYQLQMVRGSVYVAVNMVESTGDGASDQAALVAMAGRALARIDQAGIGGATMPGALAILPEAGRVAGSERIARGQFTLQSILTLGQGDVLGLAEEGATAVAAEYRPGEAAGEDEAAATSSLLLVDYPDPDAASRAWDQLGQRLDPYLKVLSQTDSRLVLEDYAGRFMLLERTGARIELRFGLGERPR
jgi:hypothetical protein